MMLWYSGTHFQLVSCSRLTYQGPKTTSFNGSILFPILFETLEYDQKTQFKVELSFQNH